MRGITTKIDTVNIESHSNKSKASKFIIKLSNFQQTNEIKNDIRNFTNNINKNLCVPLNSPQKCKRLITHRKNSINNIKDLLRIKNLDKLNLNIKHKIGIDKKTVHKQKSDECKLVYNDNQNYLPITNNIYKKESLSEVLIDNILNYHKTEKINPPSKNFNYIHSEYLNSVISEESIFNISRKCKFILP
jgi:hypothetical protein